MWSIKRKMAVLAVMVGAVASAWGAEPTYEVDVYPLTFGSQYSSDQQLAMWNRLMKYKLFATGLDNGGGIFAEERVHITDDVGYMGSAKGGLKLQNNEHEFGGPMLFGGTFQAGTQGDTIRTGPTRFKGYFNAMPNSKFKGSYCFDGGYNQNAANGVNAVGGTILSETACQSTDVVYAVDADLDVPTLSVSPTYRPAINAAGNVGVQYIHVPPTTDESAFLYYVESINFTNAGKLHIVMPPKGRLTKIYVRDQIKMDQTNVEIVVVYAKNATWDEANQKWVGFADMPIQNTEYAGNVLFYIQDKDGKGLEFPTSQKTIQGTFICSGTIKLGHHTNFAGQLLAKYIHIGADFEAKDFLFVPFNAPPISLDAAADQQLTENLPAGYDGDELAVELTKPTDVEVTFKYCFKFSGTDKTGTPYAMSNDVDVSKIPVCNDAKTSFKPATIPIGETTPTTPIKVWIIDDADPELTEMFTLEIWDLRGTTFPGKKDYRSVLFFVKDNDNGAKQTPVCPTGLKFTGDEDKTLVIPDFSVLNTEGKDVGYYDIKITSVSKGTASYTVGSTLSRNEVYFGDFQFLGALNEYGTPYATIGFDVTVDGNTAKNCSMAINLNPVNDAPSATGFDKSVPENTAIGTTVGKVSASDVDGDKLYFAITYGNVDDAFKIESDGTVKVNSLIDYDKFAVGAAKYPLHVMVCDRAIEAGVCKGLSVTVPVNITITDVDEPPTAKAHNGSVAENSPKGTTTTAYVEAADPEQDYRELKYEIVAGNTGSAFSIDNEGYIIVNGTIDYETLTTYTLTVKVTDKASNSVTVDVVVDILDANELPTISNATFHVAENSAKGTAVGKVTGSDVETAPESLTFSILAGNESGKFAMDKFGNITVSGALDFETQATYVLYVMVTDEGGLTAAAPATVSIAIDDVNEDPTTKDEQFKVSENAPVGTAVGYVTFADVDTKEEFRKNRFSIVDGDDKQFFDIDATTGLVKTKVVFDFEARTSYALKVKVSDGDSKTKDAISNVTITITDLMERTLLEITHAETGSGDKEWNHPKEPISINETSVLLKWTADGKPMPDTLVENLHEGYNTITLTYKNPTKNEAGKVQQVVFVSTKTPVVIVTANVKEENNDNIFTIAEEKDKNDSTVYVKDKESNISITVKTPILDESYTDSTCKYSTTTMNVNTKLEPVTVPAEVYTAMNKVVSGGVYLDENPSTPVTRAPYNGDQIKVSYTQKIEGVDVIVTYVTDEKGNPIKEAVIGPSGKEEMVEVITVSMEKKIGDQTVTISYKADGATGAPIPVSSFAANNGGASNGSTAGGTMAGSNSGSNSGTTSGSTSGSNSGSTSGSTGSNGGSSNGSANGGFDLDAIFTITYDYTSKETKGNAVQVSYTVDKKGNLVKDADGNVGYTITYTYENEFGNSASESVFVVVDLIPPKVKIVSPSSDEDTTVYSNTIDVIWTVDYGDGRGPQIQDTLTTQGLEKGLNAIVRFYRDKAGNVASDTAYVYMKNSKDVDIQIEKPITMVSKDSVQKYYAVNKPAEGQTFSITIVNPKTQEEVETQVGGSFSNRPSELQGTPYPGSSSHLGPTMSIETKLPAVSSIGGLATLDDLVGKDGLVSLDGVDAANSEKVSLDDYVMGYTNAKGEKVEHCNDEFRAAYKEVNGDISKLSMYQTSMTMKIWIYTAIGQFVDYFTFTQDLNDPDMVSDAGMLKLYFEQKPDENGDLRTNTGKLYATGAYIYKTEVTMRTKLLCDMPPVNDESNAANKKNAKRKVTEDMLKTFGYKRPSKK